MDVKTQYWMRVCERDAAWERFCKCASDATWQDYAYSEHELTRAAQLCVETENGGGTAEPANNLAENRE